MMKDVKATLTLVGLIVLEFLFIGYMIVYYG